MTQPLGGQQLADARVVGHLREGPRVRPAASAAARAAVVGRLVRVVEADRSVSDDEHERRQAIANPDVLEDTPHDVRHLPHREPGMLSRSAARLLAIQLQAGSRRGDRRLAARGSIGTRATGTRRAGPAGPAPASRTPSSAPHRGRAAGCRDARCSRGTRRRAAADGASVP